MCAQQNDAKKALEVYAQMKAEGVSVASYVYNMIINLCSKSEDLAAFKTGAYEVYEDMKQASADQDQVKTKKTPVVVGEPIYSAMIKLCSKAQDFDACEKLLAELEAKKVMPKLRTFDPLLQAHSDAGNLDKCVWVYEKFVSHELQPTEDDYVALLRVCVKAGHAERFYAFLDQFIDQIWQPSLSTWGVLKEWFSR
jgi:proteinaceous RNase P